MTNVKPKVQNLCLDATLINIDYNDETLPRDIAGYANIDIEITGRVNMEFLNLLYEFIDKTTK
jgi:hypothetical protein